MKRFSRILNLVLVALGAWLLAGIINVAINHELRSDLTLPILSHGPSPAAPSARPRKDNQVITRKNLFESALAGPVEPFCSKLSIDSTWMIGKPIVSIRGGFDFPDTYLHSQFKNCECQNDWCRENDSMKCAQVLNVSVYENEIKGLAGSEMELFFCRVQRPSWQEANFICVVADGGKIIHWKHLWEQDGTHRRVLAQGGKLPEDRACTWLRARYEP